MVKNEFLGKSLVEIGLDAHSWIDEQTEAISIGGRRGRSRTFDQGTGTNKRTDFCAETGFRFPLTNDREDGFGVASLISLKVLNFRPTLDSFKSEETGVHAVHQIVETIGGVVGPIHDLAFQASVVVEVANGCGINAGQDKVTEVFLFITDKLV